MQIYRCPSFMSLSVVKKENEGYKISSKLLLNRHSSFKLKEKINFHSDDARLPATYIKLNFQFFLPLLLYTMKFCMFGWNKDIIKTKKTILNDYKQMINDISGISKYILL